MSRTSYDAAFAILKTQNEMCNKLEGFGFNFEYGSGFIGDALLSLLDQGEIIIKEALGLHGVPIDRTYGLGGINCPTVDYALYPEDDDVNWSMTEDDFCEFFYKAIQSMEIQDLMWKAMVERDESAKAAFNNLNIGKIGPSE